MIVSPPTMRVLHVVSADLWAGAAVQVYETVSDLRNRNVEVLVAAFNEGAFARRMEAENFAWRLFDERRLSLVQITRELARFIEDTQPQFLHVHAHKEHILTAVARQTTRKKTPIVRTIHGTGHVPATWHGPLSVRKRTVIRLENYLLPRSVLIAVSRDIEDLLHRTYPRARVELVPNGIRMPAVFKSAEEVRSRWGVARDSFWVGCVARLEVVKNIPCLVRAASMLAGSIPNLRVSIFGTGSQQPTLQGLAGELGAQGIVTLHGFDDDMPTTTSAFDCFALTSFDEGMPMSLLEAMALGVPPVCSAVGGVRELIRHGDTGLLFESDDHTALAAALRRLYESKDTSRRIGLAAQRLVRQSFDIGVTNAALLQVYRSLVADSVVPRTAEGPIA